MKTYYVNLPSLRFVRGEKRNQFKSFFEPFRGPYNNEISFHFQCYNSTYVLIFPRVGMLEVHPCFCSFFLEKSLFQGTGKFTYSVIYLSRGKSVMSFILPGMWSKGVQSKGNLCPNYL